MLNKNNMNLQPLKEENKKEFDEYISKMIKNEILYRHDDQLKAEDTADTVNEYIARFIENITTKAYEEGKREKSEPCEDGETKTYKLLNRRAMGINTSKFFNSKKVKKTGYFYFLGNHCWFVSNNNLNRKRNKDVKDVDTYLFKDVLLNLDVFFKKEDCEKHFLNLIEIISNSPDKQVDRDLDEYLIKNNKFL